MSVVTMSTNRDTEGDGDMDQDESMPKMPNEFSTVSDDDMANSTGRLHVAPSATEENDSQGAEVEKVSISFPKAEIFEDIVNHSVQGNRVMRNSDLVFLRGE